MVDGRLMCRKGLFVANTFFFQLTMGEELRKDLIDAKELKGDA